VRRKADKAFFPLDFPQDGDRGNSYPGIASTGRSAAAELAGFLGIAGD
jgi:hypothetical protein